MDHVDEKGCWTVFDNDGIRVLTYCKNGFMFIRVAEDEIMNLHETMKKGGHRNIMLEFENNKHLIKLLKMYSINGIDTKILPIQYTPFEVESAVGSHNTHVTKSIDCLVRHTRKERVRKNIQTKDGDDYDGTADTIDEPSPKKPRITASITTDDDDEAHVDHSLLDVPTADGRKKKENPTTTSPITFTAVDEACPILEMMMISRRMMMDITIDDKGERKGVLPSADNNNTSTTKSGEDNNNHESSLSISGNDATGESNGGSAKCRGSGSDDDAAAAAAVDINIVNDPQEEEMLLVINEERTTGSSVGRCAEICGMTIRDVVNTIVDTISDPCVERRQQTTKGCDDEDQDGPDNKSYLPANNNDDEATPQELIYENDNDHDDDHREDAQLDDGNSRIHIYLLTLPMIFLIGILLRIGLFTYIPTSVIVTKFIITLFRFMVMGLCLLPFGRWDVVEYPMRIISYVVLLVAIASYEVSSRTKYTFDGQFYYIMGPIIFNVSWVLLVIFQGILGELRHVLPLPIVGMLVVSSIDSISSSLDIITKSFVENQVDELVPRFGNNTTNYEVGNELFIRAIQESSMMPLNMIRDILIMSMLGMIGGRFLGGSKPIGTDVGCQMKIILLIAVCTLSTILLNYVVMMELVLFSEQQVLCTDQFTKNDARSLIEVMVGAFAGK
jgi:ABC-type iron transport system FetAB permease component